ncbi:MAG: methyltransferase domain-containing protein [Desulfobacterales bacterium]|nr:methyltransferase domain-containing protein [Desulfobacterales bacterium]
MKQLPAGKSGYKDLYAILMGQVKARLMMTAVELGVFNQLAEFRLPDDVARSIGAHPDNTRRFLDALAMIDLVEKENGRYRNAPSTRTFLMEGSPGYLGPLFQMIRGMSIDPLDDLTKLVKEGPSPAESEETFGSEERWAEAARASSAWVFGEVGVLIARILSRLDGFSSFEKMLDLGGGPGIFSLYIVDAHPAMKGVVFDQPGVVEVAREFIGEYGMEGRVDVLAGDYTSDDIGRDYDLIWASATLNFVKDRMDPFLKKIYDALKPGGYFASFQDGMTHEGTKPDAMLGHVADTLRTGVDFSLEQGFVADAALRCGFRSVRSRTIETPMGALDLDICRK